jgi:hypothetical protein
MNNLIFKIKFFFTKTHKKRGVKNICGTDLNYIQSYKIIDGKIYFTNIKYI